MRKVILIITSIIFIVGQTMAQLDGTPGAFARLGFGARGMGMGNALTAVRDGDVSSFYNPAVTPFLTDKVLAVSYGILSLDRSLNTLSYSQSIRPTAGFSVGIINAGVRNIDGRDADGFQTEEYYTSENQFSFSFANQMSKYVSLGIGFKIYYYRLFAKVSSTSLGIDVGSIVRLTDNLSLGAAVIDIGSKYKWDTSVIYDEEGSSTTERFPQLRKIGLSYAFGDGSALVSAELENSNFQSNIVRFGGEIALSEQFTVRAGLDHWETSDPQQASPTFGFSVKTSSAAFVPTINYAYVVEPYSLFAMHVVSLSSRF
ncbi:MAG TPA: hypothetical protein VMM58_09220 [Bacteroidota bacterium]|nr:hypothetical protein [Bacteroidota bacterium]